MRRTVGTCDRLILLSSYPNTQAMQLRNLALCSLWQTQHVLTTTNRLSSTSAHKDTKSSLYVPHAPLTVNTVRIPVSGSFARVGYADLGRHEGAVCLAFHGAPGSISDMLDLAPQLTEAGFRLLVPEFPGYGNTEMEDVNAFDHSSQARTELVQNFLSAMKVNRVAAVVGHSLGSVMALHLAANTDLCQSVVFLSGLGLKPHRGIRPFWLCRSFAWLLANKLTGPLASQINKFTSTIRGLRVESDADMRIGILTLGKLDFHTIHNDVKRLHTKRLPILSAVSQMDRLIEWQIPVELAQQCSPDVGHITYFDEKEHASSPGTSSDTSVGYPRILVFSRGGHFVHRSHRNIVADAIVRLMEHVSSLPNGSPANPS